MIAQSKRGATAGFVLSIVVALLFGCTGDVPIDVRDYTSRLERVLDEAVPKTPVPPMPKLPRVRDLKAEFSAPSIDMLDFLEIRGCELQALVAGHNSSLGRLALPSKQLVYELNFLRTAAACVDRLQAEAPDLAATLQAIVRIKQEELPARIWQATLGGDEFRALWATGSDHELPVADSLQSIRWLSTEVSRWKGGDYRVDEGLLEENLAEVARGGGGAVLKAWWYLDHQMIDATRVLKAREARRPLCIKGMKNPDAEIFRTVVSKFFLAGIQREVAILNRVTFELAGVVEALEDQLRDAEPAAYTRWREQRRAMIVDGRQSMVDHVAAIEPFFTGCGFLPATIAQPDRG